MSSLYGIGLDLSVDEIQKHLKVHIMKHGGGFIEKLQKIFEIFDLNGNGKLDLMEFEKGLNKFGFFPKKVEVQALLKYYDTNNDNMIDFKEFCQALREPLNERKYRFVSKVYDILAKELTDPLPLKELIQRLDVTKNVLFVMKTKTKEELYQEFEAFFAVKGLKSVSKQDFIKYYEEQNVFFSSENSFIQSIEKSWGINETDDNEKDKELINEKLSMIRSKIVEKLKGKTTFENVLKLFNSFDVQTSASLTFFEFQNAMKRLHIALEDKLLGILFKKIDLNNSGFIEFQEFFDFITLENK